MEQTIAIVQTTPAELRNIIREEISLIRSSHLEAAARQESPKEWLSNAEAMKYLTLSRTSLQRLRTGGRLPFSKLGAGTIRYRKSDLDQLLENSLHIPEESEV